VALAVAALTAVGFLADRMQSGLWRDARQLLGGDAVVVSDQRTPQAFVQKAQVAGLQSNTNVSFPTMARAMARLPWPEDVREECAIVVPLPLSATRQRERGYNQTALLAEILVRVAGGGARVEPLLRRVVDTATQTAFDRRSRMANLKNAFALARGASLNPDQHYLLVDDVFTTGSTLNSCALALRRAGGLNLDVVTFGHG
jgi:ComF family protein